MKRFFVSLLFIMLSVSTLQAQSWKDMLKDIASTVADEVTDGALTQYAIVGEWAYSSPAVKFTSDDMLAEIGSAAISSTIESKLERVYQIVGFSAGACFFTFDKEGNMSAKIGKHTLTGSYEFDSSTHAIQLKFAAGKINLGTINGFAYISGSDLDLAFPADKLLDMVTKLGAKFSSLASLTAILEKYDGVLVGFKFSKK